MDDDRVFILPIKSQHASRAKLNAQTAAFAPHPEYGHLAARTMQGLGFAGNSLFLCFGFNNFRHSLPL
jgi:hypothetical protein